MSRHDRIKVFQERYGVVGEQSAAQLLRLFLGKCKSHLLEYSSKVCQITDNLPCPETYYVPDRV